MATDKDKAEVSLGAYAAGRPGIDHLADQQSWQGSFSLAPAQAFIRLRAR